MDAVQRGFDGAITERMDGDLIANSLRLFHHLSFAEIGEAQGITANNAKVNFHHGVRRIKAALAARGVAA